MTALRGVWAIAGRVLGRRTPPFLHEISSCKRLLPHAVEGVSKNLREMPGQSVVGEAGFAGWLAMPLFRRL